MIGVEIIVQEGAYLLNVENPQTGLSQLIERGAILQNFCSVDIPYLNLIEKILK